MMSSHTRQLCVMACAFCRDPLFFDWLLSLTTADGRPLQVWAPNAAGAKAFILHICEIDSRADLDFDIVAAKRFHERVRIPFVTWKEQQK